jgi:hypothetical protein
MDRTTFGKSEVALYLADKLNEIDNDKVSNKVSSRISKVRAILKDIEKARECKAITEKTWHFMMNCLIDRVRRENQSPIASDELDVSDEGLLLDLTTNLLIGEIRRAKEEASAKGKKAQALATC